MNIKKHFVEYADMRDILPSQRVNKIKVKFRE